MADRYFDRNGATAGFGTLTGAWDTTTASWSTSSAGTATPAVFTFSNADAARFGETGTSATAGTATIANGITVTLNGIYTRNLAATQTVAATGTGNLVIDGTTPFFDAGSYLLVSAPINGTVGFTKLGADVLQITSASNPISGTATVSAGSIVVGTFNSGAPNGLNSLTSLVISASGNFYFWGATAYTFAVPFSGSGLIGTNNPGTVTLSDAGSISDFTGTYQVNADNTVAGKLRLNAFPTNASKLLLQGFTTGSTARTFTVATHHSSAGATSALVEISAANASTGGVAVLEDNGTASSTFNGNVTNASGSNSGATLRLRLSGTNTASTYAGNILATNASGGLGVTKEDAGSWALSGSNTFAGSVLVSAGTLTAKSSGALGASTGAVTVSSGATLTLDGGVTVNKAGTQLTLHTSDPITSVGDNTLQFATLPLAGTTTFTVGTGNALRLINSGAISGSAGITKAGDGELELGTGASSYSGTCTVSAGTLTVKSMNDQSAFGVFGNSTNRVALTGTLKFNGLANANTNKVELQGAAPSLDASGTSGATATFTSFAQTNTARTLTLTGSGEGIISATLANSTQATGVTKAGTGLWRLTGAVTTGGAVAVNAGRLRIQTATSNASMTSTVTVGASGVLELITDELASSSSTAGRVAGTGNMTVSGEVKTRGGVTQKGQVRYGGNLTFNAGSKLYIGAAA